MSVSTLSQQHAQLPNAVFLQIDTPRQNETSTLTASSTQHIPLSPVVDDASISWEALKTPRNLRAISSKLKRCYPRLYLNGHSSLFLMRVNAFSVAIQLDPSQPPTRLPLAQVLTKLGYTLPTNGREALALMQSVQQQVTRLLWGNFGGGRSWPIPMSGTDEDRLASFLSSETTGVPGLPLPRDGRRTLGYLLSGSSVTPADLGDPPKALEKLLTSPKAVALGQALQTHLAGVPSESSISDYLLSAIHIGLDPSSLVLQRRNIVDKVDLMQPAFWGKPASTVIADLSRNLIAHDRVTPYNAKLGVYVLLAKHAPHLLIKDIPDNVTVGSHAWAFLSIAAARIEAERPGAVASMSFVDVMSCPASNGQRSYITEQAQEDAIVDWGIANGVIKKNAADDYSPEQINTVRIQFNQQLKERLEASNELERGLPTLKEIATRELDIRFDGPKDLYEARVLSTDHYSGTSSQTGLAGTHSMLDIAMMGMANLRPFVSSNPRIPLAALNKNLSFLAPKAFEQQFDMAIKRKKVAANTTARHLISQLPVGDRRQLEFGKITLFREGSYTLGTDFFETTGNGNKPGLIVKTELEGNTRAYLIDMNNAAIERVLTGRASARDQREGNVVSTTREFKTEDAASGLGVERPANSEAPNTFNSERIRSIADEYVKHLNLDNPAIKQEARGQTALDKLKGGPKPLDDFLLNLIPFKSAILNFQAGHYGEGTFDLAMDIFGFLTAGMATAGKLVKIGSSALSSGTKALKAVKVIGVATIDVLNPVGGLGDLAYGGANLLGKAARKLREGGAYTANLLKGATGSYDLLKAASKGNRVAATGTYKLTRQTVENGAILKDKKWYAFDPISQRPYGPPLTDFKPEIIAADRNTLAKFDEPTQQWYVYDSVKQQIERKPLENFTLDRSYSLETLMPSPRLHDGVRYNPLSQVNRSKQQVNKSRVPLPLDEYATSRETGGALILDHFTPSRIKTTREKFKLEMDSFFKDVAAGNVPPRPELPTITAKTTPDELIAEALKKTDVLVFGENHTEVASLVTLRDSMKTLKDNNVKAIFMEGTTLDPSGLIADGHIGRNIKSREGGQTLFDELKQAAEANDIEIMPLEHYFLTRHMDDPKYFSRGTSAFAKGSPEYNAFTKERLEEVNYYGARQVMKNELGGKSVVWVGRKHMTTGEGVPGISELTGGISIGVYQKSGIARSVVRKEGKARDPIASIPTADNTVGDFQIDVKV